MAPFTPMSEAGRRVGDALDRIRAGSLAEPAPTLDELRRVLDGRERVAVVVGPRDAGKTVTALWAAGTVVAGSSWYARADRWATAGEAQDALTQLRTYDDPADYQGPSLFILDDCHVINEWFSPLADFLDHLDAITPLRQAAVILTARTTAPAGSPLDAFADARDNVVPLSPEQLRHDVAETHLRRHGVAITTDVADRLDSLLRSIPLHNLRLLDLWLTTWIDRGCRLEELDAIDRDHLLATVVHHLEARADLPITSPPVRGCLFPLAALGQFEIDVEVDLFEPEHIESLRDLGLIECDDEAHTVRLSDPSEGPWLIEAAALRRHLRLGDRTVNADDFVSHWLEAYARRASTTRLAALLAALQAQDVELARTVAMASELDVRLEHLQDDDLTPALPRLVGYLPALMPPEACARTAQALGAMPARIIDHDPRIALRLVTELTAWSPEGGGLPEAVTDASRTAARSLAATVLEEPEATAETLRARHSTASSAVADLELLLAAAQLHPQGQRRARDSMERLAVAYPFSDVVARFPEVGLRRYLDLLAAARRARVGTWLVAELTPDVESMATRLADRSLARLHHALRVVPSRSRNRLWRTLGAEDLQAIVDRSSAYQLSVFLQYLERSSDEYEQVGGTEGPADRLLRLDLRTMLDATNIGTASALLESALTIAPDAANHLVEQLTSCDLAAMMNREQERREVIARLSLLLKHVYLLGPGERPSVAAQRLLAYVAEEVFLPRYLDVTTKGLQYLAGFALSIDEEEARRLFAPVTGEHWLEAIRNDGERDAFWCLWNLSCLNRDLAVEVAAQEEVRDRLPQELATAGLLVLCGARPSSIGDELIPTRRRDLPLRSPTRAVLALHAVSECGLAGALGADAAELVSELRSAVAEADVGSGARALLEELLNGFERTAVTHAGDGPPSAR